MNKQLKQYKDLAEKGPRRQRCPVPGCPSNQEPWLDPWEASQCTLNQPLWMVIPPEGVHLSCPVHPEGHHIYGSGTITTWEEIPMWKEDNLPNRKNEPYCEGTGFTGKDTNKFSM